MVGIEDFFTSSSEPKKKMDEDVKSYLLHSYLYYVLNSPIIQDTEFDLLCKRLLDRKIKHPLISEESLKAGTGFNIKEYPQEIIDEAKKLFSLYIKETSYVKELEKEKESDLSDLLSNIDTYLLLGFYIDYGYTRIRDKQKIIQDEILKRWESGNRNEFFKYFRDHRETPKRFGIKENGNA